MVENDQARVRCASLGQRTAGQLEKALAGSTPQDPAPIVGTYDFRHAVLLPTRANGPLTNQSKPETIIDYFRGFLKDTPVVEFDKPIVGENYGDAALN
jgi:hypothetical protein